VSISASLRARTVLRRAGIAQGKCMGEEKEKRVSDLLVHIGRTV
jgi:hypothetical protein